MLFFRRIFFSVILVFSISSVSATNSLLFEHISIADGLSHGTVNSTVRDTDGFLWICTEEGVNRYDGYAMKHYTLDDYSQNIDYECVTMSADGKLWFGTSVGLLCYSPYDDRLAFFHDIAQVDPALRQYNSRVNAICYGKDDLLWVGSWDGLFTIDLKDKEVSAITNDDITFYSDRDYPENNKTEVIINSIAQDSQGLIWMTTGYPKLVRYTPQDGVFSSVDIASPSIQSMKYNFNKLLIDKSDNIYIYTEGAGIVYWDRMSGTFEELPLVTFDGRKVAHGIVRTMMIDSVDRLWIGTDGHGFFIRDNNVLTQYNTGRKEYSNINCDVIYSLYEDGEQNIWIGTYLAGLNKLSKSKTNFGLVTQSSDSRAGLSGNLVFDFLEDHKGYIWVATDGGGLNRIDPKSQKYKHYFPDASKKNSISTKTTIALHQDHNKDIWIGSYNGGLNRYNYATDDFTTFYHAPDDPTSICSNHPWGFAEDHFGNLWIASNSNGIDLKRRNEERFINYSDDVNDAYDVRTLSSNALTHLLVDSRNYLWVGTEGGLDMINLNEVDFSQDVPDLNVRHFKAELESNSISSSQVTYLEEGSYGDVWIGTKGGGLNKYILEKDSFVTYTKADGLPHNIIQGIVFDDDNRAWLSTSYGISTFDLTTKTFKNYTSEDGLQDNLFIKTSCYKTRDGKLFFGGINGFNSFYPSSVIENSHPPLVKVTSFKLFNKEVGIGEEINGKVILDRSITYVQKIVLDYRNNFFTFEFSALDFTNSQKNGYAYMMEGFDENWVYTDADMRRATYTNLDPGNYTFRVKASNNNGVWNEEGAAISLEILPPWWATLLFRISAIVFIVGLISLLFYLRIYQLRKQREKLRIQVNKRTEQLSAANESLKESNATKDKFFSIIAHDIISPFSSILGLTGVLQDKYDSLEPKRVGELITLVNRSSKQLHELLMNLLEWSRSERGSLTFKPEALDLKHMIEQSVELNSFVADNKRIKLQMDISDFEKLAYTDEQMIKTVLRNLQSNAIKFTPAGGVITVKAVEGDDFFTVSVIDDGVGMDLETQKQVFNPNNFVSTKGTNNESGTGLGLKLVSEFVAMQGGQLWVNSELGKGCEFCFTIPVVS